MRVPLLLGTVALSTITIPDEVAARRPIKQVLQKEVTKTYTSTKSVDALAACLDRELNNVSLPFGLLGSKVSINNVDIVDAGATKHVSFSPSFGGDGDKDHIWAFTASLTPSGGGTQVEIRQRGKSYNGWRTKTEKCFLTVSTDAPTSFARSPTPNEPTSTTMVADEIAKLADLRDRGVITEQEFQARKALLLK